MLSKSLGRRLCGFSATRPAALVTAPTQTQQRRQLSSPGMDFLLNPTPEHQMLRETVARFAKEDVAPAAQEMDKTMDFNHDLFRKLGSLGVHGVTIPEEAGGAGMDATAAVIVHHELSKVDPGFCLAYLAHSMLFVNNFFFGATDFQKKKYLEKTLTGEWIGAMGMSEPGAGTDVLGMTSTARKEGAKYILNGGKTWITNGPQAKVFLIYAKVDGKITAFIVDRDSPGFTVGAKIDKCGMRASSMCPLYFDNVEVPAENLVGEEGKGMVHMMRNLEIERVTLAAMAVGIADSCTEHMIKYSNDRKAFGQSISRFGQIQRYIAESFAETEAAKTLTYAVARNVSPSSQNRVGTDAAKLFCTPVGKRVADNAMQVMGGMGYTKDMPVERLWRDAKLLEIGGGTLESHHKNLTKDLTKML